MELNKHALKLPVYTSFDATELLVSGYDKLTSNIQDYLKKEELEYQQKKRHQYKKERGYEVNYYQNMFTKLTPIEMLDMLMKMYDPSYTDSYLQKFNKLKGAPMASLTKTKSQARSMSRSNMSRNSFRRATPEQPGGGGDSREDSRGKSRGKDLSDALDDKGSFGGSDAMDVKPPSKERSSKGVYGATLRKGSNR